MRVEFVQAVERRLPADPRQVFFTGDLGFKAFEGLREKLASRFINAGVAEQNMMGLAAGAALAGFSPWVYSIAPFCTFRCLEQIRNDVCLHDLPVKIAGNGGGYTYGIMGSTHHSLEDLAALKALPNLRLFFPCTPDQVAPAVDAMLALDHPAYLRLAVSGHTASASPLADNPRTLTRTYSRGDKTVLVGIGHALQVILAALDSTLADIRHELSVFGIARYPFDLENEPDLLAALRSARAVITVDEHYRPGSVSESLAAEAAPLAPRARWEILAAGIPPGMRYGSPRFLQKQCGLDPETLRARVLAAHS